MIASILLGAITIGICWLIGCCITAELGILNQDEWN